MSVMMYATPVAGFLASVIRCAVNAICDAMFRKRKAQINIFTQPLMLIILISIFAIFVVKTVQMNVYITKEVDAYKFKSKADALFEQVLRCVSDNSTKYPYLVSAYNLNRESIRFSMKSPPCVRDESYGWNAVVRDITSGAHPSVGKSWQFGEPEGSNGTAKSKEFSITMPVAIKYVDGTVNPGDLTLNMKDGDLEYIVGHIESVYRVGTATGKDMTASLSMRFDYPVVLEESSPEKRICIKSEDPSCETLSLSSIELQPISAGMHYILIKYDSMRKIIVVSE